MFRLAVTALIAAALALPALAQPANDFCTGPEIIPTTSFPVTVTGDNTDASSDNPFTCGFVADDIDVWFSLTAPQAGTYTFDTVGTTGVIDPTLSLWTDCSIRVACDDNSAGGFNARVALALAAGEAIMIRFAASSQFVDFGGYQINVAFAPTPGGNNDTCASAAAIVALPYSDTRDLFTATDDADAACNDPVAGATRNGRWYSYTASANQVVRFEISNGVANVIIAVYTGSCATPSAFVCQGGIGFGGINYGITCPLAAGTTYRILIGSYNATPLAASLSVNFTATLIAAPPNDLCAGATPVAALPFSQTVNFPTASFDLDVACNSTFRNNAVTHNGIWFAYTPANNQAITFTFPVSSGAAALAVYTGGCASPTEATCFSSFPANFNVSAGTPYRFLLGAGGSLGASFTNTLTISTTSPPPSNDQCSGAIALTSGTPFNGNNGDATIASDGPSASCQTGTLKGVWFSFTPAATASHRIATCGSAHDTVLTVYTGTCAALTEFACDDDGCGGSADADLTSDIADIALTGGTTYLIRVSAFDASPGPTGGPYTILVAPNSGPGACCRGSTCVTDTSANCIGTNAGFAGEGTVCNAFGVNNRTPCCLADFNHLAGVTVQDIFDFLSAYFTANPLADINAVAGITVQDIFDFLNAYFGGCP